MFHSFRARVGEPVLLALDAAPLIHQFYYINSDRDDVVERFLTRIDRLYEWLLERLDAPLLCFSCFDNGQPTFRHELYESYKADREKNLEIRAITLEIEKALVNACHWNSLVAPDGYESDDVLASLAKQYDGKVILHTVDKDAFQLLEKGRVTIIRKSNVDAMIGRILPDFFSAESMQKQFGFGPDRFIDWQCLVGDSADGIRGASGIGPKTAQQLMRDHIRPIEEWDVERMQLTAARTVSILSLQKRLPEVRKLLTLITDLELPDLDLHPSNIQTEEPNGAVRL